VTLSVARYKPIINYKMAYNLYTCYRVSSLRRAGRSRQNEIRLVATWADYSLKPMQSPAPGKRDQILGIQQPVLIFETRGRSLRRSIDGVRREAAAETRSTSLSSESIKKLIQRKTRNLYERVTQFNFWFSPQCSAASFRFLRLLPVAPFPPLSCDEVQLGVLDEIVKQATAL
jgi:hypothetical protein